MYEHRNLIHKHYPKIVETIHIMMVNELGYAEGLTKQLIHHEKGT
jgi:hypothetical protein